MYQGTIWNQFKKQLAGLLTVLGDQGVNAIGFESQGGAFDLLI